MNPTSEDIKDFIEQESDLDLAFATNLFIGREPATPDNCVTIFDTPGYPPSMTLKGKEEGSIFYPSIQIRVRNNDYQTGWNLIDRIKLLLHGTVKEIINSTSYDYIKCISEPFLLGFDEADRALFVSTFDICRK